MERVTDPGIRPAALRGFGKCPACPHQTLIHDEHGCGVLDCGCPSIDDANEKIDAAVEADQDRRRRGGSR